MVNIIGRKVPVGNYGLPPRKDSVGGVFAAMAAPFMNSLDNDLKRAKLDESDREAQGLAGVQAAIDAARGGGDVDIYDLVRSGVTTKRSMSDISDIMPMIYGNTRGAQDRSTTNALVGAGKGYGSTYHGVQDDFANKRTMQSMADSAATNRALQVNDAQVEMTMGPDGPVFSRRGDAVGQRPVMNLSQEQGAFAANNVDNLDGLSPTQKSFISAEPSNKQPYTYVTPDGRSGTTLDSVTDAQTQEALPPGVQIKKLEGESADNIGGNTLVKQITERRVAARQAIAAVDRLDAHLAQPDADQAIGWIGSAAGLFNGVRSQVEAATRLVGGSGFAEEAQRPEIMQALRNAMNDPGIANTARRLGIQNDVLQSQVVDLAYMIAKAHDPGGRLSDQDIRRAAQIIGGSIMDPSSTREVLRDVKARMEQNQQIWEEEFSRTRGGGVMSPAPQGGPAQGGAVRRYNPATGRIE